MVKLRVDKIASPIVKDEFTGSVFFDGNGDHLDVPLSDDFQFGAGDFTIEAWVYIHTAKDAGIFGTNKSTGSFAGYELDVFTNGSIRFYSGNGSAYNYSSLGASTAAGSVPVQTWTHIVASRQGNTLRLFVNGVLSGSNTSFTHTIPDSPTAPDIGSDGISTGSTYHHHGYISNLRVCKGHAVYTGNFTVSTKELEVHTKPPKGVVFPAADNVTVLLACQSSTDTTLDSSGRHAITAAGNVHAQSANPGLLRRTNISSTITENTGSVFFDGTSDGLRSSSYDELTLGTGAFTVECWFWRQNITDSWGSLVSDNLYSASGGWDLYTQYDDIRFYVGGVGEVFTVTEAYSAQTWTHVAAQRDSAGNMSCYINGVEKGVTATNTTNYTDNRILIGGNNSPAGSYPAYVFNGYISNVRVCKGHNVYTSNFAPPTRELEVHPGPEDDRTVLLACYDGENVFAEKTGKIIAANGDRLSSPTPTATDSPIGITTFQPGLTRNVDPTDGPTFQGGVGFVSQNWLTLPKGTTTERMPSFGGDQSGTRGFFAGGYNPTRTNVINYVNVPTLGDAIDFGNLGSANGGPTGFSDSTRGWIAGGNISPTRTNVMEYVTMASSGNSVDGGDLITATSSRPGSVANSIRGVIAGGSTPGQVRTIVHHTIQTTGIVQYFGDLTEVKSGVAGVMSPTRGVFAGGNTPSGRIDTIEHITIASTGNAVLFGELSLDDRSNMGGASNTVRGLFGGGRSPTDYTHIEYITIATLGNGQDFGDLTQNGMDGDIGAVSNSTRVVFGGGASDELGYVEIATLGNTTQFGKFTVNTTANQDPACFSSGHGGLG